MAYKLHHQHADEESGKSAAMVHSQPRRKGIGTRVWLVVSESGHTHIEEVGKHSIMRRTGLPARDLRVLDPMLLYPSTILGRERAIVINLEHIMAIITAKEVLMVNSTNPLVVQFVQDLQERVSCSKDTQQQATKNCDTDMEDAVEGTWGSPSINSHHVMSGNFNNLSDMPNTEKGSSNSATGRPEAPGPKLLPFEFRALEVCLESACRCLESEVMSRTAATPRCILKACFGFLSCRLDLLIYLGNIVFYVGNLEEYASWLVLIAFCTCRLEKPFGQD